MSEEITIKVSPKVAQIYQNATESEKQWVETLVAVLFDPDLRSEVDFLGKIMDEVSDRAVSRGLTPEIEEFIF